MALPEGAVIDQATAVQIIAAAVQSAWDRDFTSNDKIKAWLLEQVQRVPFDPRSVLLLDYVKSRMQAAEVQQRQQHSIQQQQQHQAQNSAQQQYPVQQQQVYIQPQPIQYTQQQQLPSRSLALGSTLVQQAQQSQQQHASQPTFAYPSSSSSSAPGSSRPIATSAQIQAHSQQPPHTLSGTSSGSNGTQYNVISDDESSGHRSEDDQPYQFDLDDFAGPSAGTGPKAGGLSPARPPSPALPPPLSSRQDSVQSTSNSQIRPSSSSSNLNSQSNTLFPFANGQAQQSHSSQPFSQSPANAAPPPVPRQSHYHHQALPISQPVTMNPALLFSTNSMQYQPGLSSSSQIRPQPISSMQLTQSNGPTTPQASSSSLTSNGNVKPNKRRSDFEVVVPQRREGSTSETSNPASKRKKASSDAMDPARQPLSATVAPVQQQKKKKTSPTPSSATSSSAGAHILTTSTNTPPLPSDAEQKWREVKKEVLRHLGQANRTPHKAVLNIFKCLTPFVAEPPGATSRQNSREAYTTDLQVPTEARLAILEVIRDETNNDFDVIFVVDPRATVLLHEWTKDLALIAKGKYNGSEEAKKIKTTARSLIEVLRKLPITLDVLRALKGVGSDVMVLSKSDDFDEVTKDIAGQLVKKWRTLAMKADGKLPTTASLPAPSIKRKTESTGPVSKDDDDDNRKKRKVSPIPTKAPASISSTASKATSTSTSKVSSSTTSAPTGTRPLGAPKAAPVGKSAMFAKRKPVAPAVVKPVAKPAVSSSAPAAFDPFAMSLQDMAASKESAASSGMSVGDTLNMLHKAVDGASGRQGGALSSSMAGSSSLHTVPRAGAAAGKRKSVKWALPEDLEKIKYIEKLVYGDEFGNEIANSDYFNTAGETQGEHEGAAMKGLAEQIDWEEPQPVNRNFSQDTLDMLTDYPHPELIGSGPCERDLQAEREKTTLATTYFSEAEIPPSPAEPSLAFLQAEKDLEEKLGLRKEAVVMRLSHGLENDQGVQLAILQAQTARSTGQQQDRPVSTEATLASQASTLQPAPNAYQSLPTTSPYGHQAVAPTGGAAVLGGAADLGALLAQLSDSGLANLATQPLQSAQNQHAPVMNPQMQHHQQPQIYPHIQPYQPPYQQRY